MMHTTIKQNIANVGEEIGIELGKELVNNYQIANPAKAHFFEVGRGILDQILAQPGCEGMRFYKAYNELGEETLVYVGLDINGSVIFEFTVVNNQGLLETGKGIVADRARRGSKGDGDGGDGLSQNDADDWGWSID